MGRRPGPDGAPTRGRRYARPGRAGIAAGAGRRAEGASVLDADIRSLGPGDDALVLAAAHLFDHAPRPGATARFLADPGHHLLMAFVDGTAAGFVSGVELTHPDKGSEMFLYELAVDAAFRRRGIGRLLVERLAALARERACYGMWVLTADGNVAALRTYAAAGAGPGEACRMLWWDWEAQG